MTQPDRPAHGGEVTDRELVEAHLAGDSEAFGVLFGRHRDRLWAVAVRTTADPEEAADALQDAMVSAFRRAESYRGDAAVTTWLHRIVVNACLDRLRRRTLRVADPLPDDERRSERGDGLVTHTADPVDPAQHAVAAERRARVLAALDTLPAEQRAVLVLVDMEGYSVEETARIVRAPEGTVKSRCSRARARLVPLLADLGVEATTAAAADQRGDPAHTPGPPGAGNHTPGRAVPPRARRRAGPADPAGSRGPDPTDPTGHPYEEVSPDDQ